MKLKRIFLALISAVLVLAFVGCTSTPAAPAVPTAPAQASDQTAAPAPTADATASSAAETIAEGIVFKDMKGREIKLDAPVTSVVALSASDCEILYALGAGDLLVGRGEYCDYPAEVAQIPSVQSGYETNVEQIIALKPQLLILSVLDENDEQLKQFESAGIKVIVSDADDINGTYTAINMIGAAVGKTVEAEALVKSMEDTFSELAKKAGDGTKTVYFEVSPLEYGLWTAGANTFMNEAANILGLKNCFEDVEGWGEISQEQVIERNPDYIVTISMYFGEGPTPEEELLSRAGWENVTAIKNKAILNLTGNELSRPGPRLTDGVKLLGEFVFGK